MYKLINDNLKKKKNKHFLIHDRLENLLYINRAMQVVKFRMHVPTHHPIIKKKNIYIYIWLPLAEIFVLVQKVQPKFLSTHSLCCFLLHTTSRPRPKPKPKPWESSRKLKIPGRTHLLMTRSLGCWLSLSVMLTFP